MIPIGRFAPTPSGLLHLGSLVVALASFLEVKSQKGKWYIRFDDLDTARVQKGAREGILKQLESFGFDIEDCFFQSQRISLYEEYLQKLLDEDKAYYCTCTRGKKGTYPQNEEGGWLYQGQCRFKNHEKGSIRVKVPCELWNYEDLLQGNFSQNIFSEIGDFILKRADGVFSYHFASAIDDGILKMNHWIRGEDLLGSVPRQLFLLSLFHFPLCSYAHIPLVRDECGQKLGKSTFAEPVVPHKGFLKKALCLLGYEPPPLLEEELLAWALENWRPLFLWKNKEEGPF